MVSALEELEGQEAADELRGHAILILCSAIDAIKVSIYQSDEAIYCQVIGANNLTFGIFRAILSLG